MKKFLSLLLAITLIFVFTACGNGKGGSSDIESTDDSEAFVKPENYATVMLVTINPEFRLYLDALNNVLAVEPVNEDAKTAIKDTELKGEFKSVMEKIVEKSNDAGFVKENATVNIKITETKNQAADTTAILNTAKSTADNAFKKINITAEIKTSVSEDASSTPEATSSSAPAENNESITSQPAHTHSFAAATCTKPKTCSCGATEGAALGHKFKDGKCSVCNAADPNFKETPIANKNGVWKAEYIAGGKYYIATITLIGELGVGVGIGDPLSEMEPEIQDDIRKNKDQEGYKDSYVVFQNKEFWYARGMGAELKPLVENNGTITLTTTEEAGAQIVLTRTDENTLTVKSVTQTFKDMVEDIPVGTKLIFKAK